ncbi:uncharacterized protein si:ch211-284e13.9 [Trichomycterus rosablanca]|uniref:uncharacterized protein si:ch211-284e13.9 n=1 Tax=Trichomycterus rosablanca TaxID=2290929 RepID=UPI002F360709
MSLPSSKPKCPICHQSDVKKLGGQCAVCQPCSKSLQRVYRFCWACQREWPNNLSVQSTCTLPNCALRAALLSDKEITDPKSSARGCPYFRACPQCKALLTHNGVGCPNIKCPECKTTFCFRCHRSRCFGIRPPIGFLSLGREIEACDIVKNRQCVITLGL